MDGSNKFRKTERLRSRKDIDLLFNKGSSFFVYPFKIIWSDAEELSGERARMAVTVPKRKFKRAVIRNLIRRRAREAYRLQKQVLCNKLENRDKNINFMLIYSADEVLNYADIFVKISAIINRFDKELDAAK